MMKASLLFVRTIQALIILVPSWTTAYFTNGKIAYVAPVIVACGILANSLTTDTLRVDDSAPDDGGEG